MATGLEPAPPPTEPSRFALSAWVFLRGLGLVYFIAFASLAVQVQGLIGSHGIAPVGQLSEWLAHRYGTGRYLLLPTLVFLDPSDASLRLACGAGLALAVLVLADIAPALALAGLWVLWLSLVNAGQDFLSFQWDVLLLEAGALAIFLAPWRLRRGAAVEPPRPFRLLLGWLLFRLMFSSAVVKLTSGDPAWRNLSALTFHYETQPLPTWTAWAVHQLPPWFHRLSAAVMFGVEGLVPFLIAGSRPVRHAAAAALVALQVLIAATGNYTFFNLLTALLCLLLVEDAALVSLARRCRIPLRARAGAEERTPRCPPVLAVPAVVLVAALTLVPLLGLAGQARHAPPPLLWLYRRTSPFHLVNNYGLFAVMTTRRPEVVVEGSSDGVEWRTYELPFKPGRLDRRPEFVAPHQPRLDWQMWFAALGRCADSPWLAGLFQRLLEGSAPVRGLFATDPFPQAPPRFVRAVHYDYLFTTPAEYAETGNWWRREPLGEFCPAVSLE